MTVLLISVKAQQKMETAMGYMGDYEVMWLGIIKKLKAKKYVLKDVLFPPQENKPSHVETKDDEFPSWFFKNIVKKNNHTNIRLHGHTHPVFATNPSGIDDQQFKEFINEVDDYMIQLIMSNTHQPYCMIHYKDGRREDVKIEFEYKNKITRILNKVINKQHPRIVPRQLSIFDEEVWPNGEPDTFENKVAENRNTCVECGIITIEGIIYKVFDIPYCEECYENMGYGLPPDEFINKEIITNGDDSDEPQ
jgi:hypothetical protein